ncbi:MAG: MmcQ/YjbR family DNA-binding protein [Absicoccus sp.]|uniref:MmcQ/YjbR family DNA-binding protein n=1 Tax=Absicoccus intestinalis TaxID=2926319 RepID=A0ABU4WKJ9_9FIRM|nr:MULTISPECIES: MmcQ/YjbR family DNA-binding protein [unclassified Absicoccus]MDX8417078.1 MmcQ/YjbR family DNA-binding protein [Absicoccus sp. CLA-KB-P134]MDY3035031.1 MmcQ/YjbR family DNA-binding protein [Absicoccus sp.]
MKEAIIQYIQKQYGIDPDYPFVNAPTDPVWNRQDNHACFARILRVPSKQLGLYGTEEDILDVKVSDPFLVDIMVDEPGYDRNHQKGNWLSIQLDGTIDLEDIYRWIDESYRVAGSKSKKSKKRGLKEWIIPANPKYYDIEHAFDDVQTIDWKQGRGIQVGDLVFMYVGAPISAILYECQVIQTHIPYLYKDKNLNISALMKIRLLKRYPPEAFSFSRLKNEFGVYAIRGPRGLPHALFEALDVYEK